MSCSALDSDGTHSGPVSRRALLAGGAGLFVAAALPVDLQPSAAPIDVHHHIFPPFYQERMFDWYRTSEAGVEAAMAWSAESMMAGLDMGGRSRAVLSLSTPAVVVSHGTEAVRMAQRCNDYAADLVRARPQQLAFFVTLPMPEVAASIVEIDRAMALPGAAGVVLLTSYDGKYLGHSTFDALIRHLHDRRLVAFVHPTVGPCCIGLTPEVRAPIIEFPVDTARAISTLLWSGSLAHYPGVRFIFSHGGGAIAMLTQRLEQAGALKPDRESRAPGGVEAMLRRIYVDTASASHAAAIAAARAQFGDGHILFGSDAPWGDVAKSLASLDQLGLEPAFLQRIRHGSAHDLLPVFDGPIAGGSGGGIAN